MSPTPWSTPRTLRGAIGAIWLASAIVFLVGLAGLSANRTALRSISRETAPRMVAAQDLGAHLADLDTELADSLLGTAADREVATELFEVRRSAANRRLVDAANDMSQGDVDRIPIVVIGEELGRYLEIAARAQWLYTGGDRDGAIALERLATSLMHARILPAAGALDAANREEMDAQYFVAQHSSSAYEVEAVLAGALLLGALLAAQVYIRRRMRRRLAPPLLAATALTVLFTAYLVGRFHDGREDLRIARDKAFASVDLLWRARAVAYDASGDESRWLLDQARAGDYEDQYRQKVARLVSRPAGALRKPIEAGMRGLLVDASNNVSFPGEREAVDATLETLAALAETDDRMRQLERQGKHVEAVQMCIGDKDGQARAAFDRFDAAVERTTAINQRAFDGVIAKADRALGRAEWLDPAFALAIALVGWLGIRARLREYA